MPVFCDLCGKEFKDKSGLAGHMHFSHRATEVDGSILEHLRSEVGELRQRLDQVLESAPACTLGDTVSTLQSEVEELKAKLKDSDEVANLKEQVAELSDPEKLKAKLMEIARTWTEDEYRQLGEALGFPTTRALTPEEEAELAEETPEAPVELKIKVGNKLFPVVDDGKPGVRILVPKKVR